MIGSKHGQNLLSYEMVYNKKTIGEKIFQHNVPDSALIFPHYQNEAINQLLNTYVHHSRRQGFCQREKNAMIRNMRSDQRKYTDTSHFFLLIKTKK